MKLCVAGLGLRGSGYPNAWQTVVQLEKHAGVEVIHCGAWLPEDLHLWKLGGMPLWRAIRLLTCIGIGNLMSLGRVLVRGRNASDWIYVPYPAIFLLCWLSLLPRRWRPRVIADAYISVWDAMFRDRSDGRTGSAASRLVRWLEGRAMRASDIVLVDTQANSHQMVQDFSLSASQVRSIPLAIDESAFLATEPYSSKPGQPVRVLFVGTMIPLHGIDAVLEALTLLRNDPRVEFRLMGEGQLGSRIEKALGDFDSGRVTWLRGWHDLPSIAREIAQSDICLGVFGGEGKAARVLPLKLYMYLAAGRAVITQGALSTPAGVPPPPIERVDSRQGNALADAILRLLDDPERRCSLARESREYYKRWLSNACVMSAWSQLVSDLPSREQA